MPIDAILTVGDAPVSFSTALSNFVDVLGEVSEFIGDSAILMTMFAGGLMVVGAKVFKRIKNSVK